MTYVVTGATGFIGQNFMAHTQAAGRPAIALLRAGADDNALPGSLTYDGSIAELAAALIEVKATTVVHCAAAFSPADEPDDTEAMLAANLDLPVRLLQAARLAGVRQFLNIGSLWEHNASGARAPVNLYAAMKTAFEDMLIYMTEAHRLSAITLKLSDTYGPDDTRPKLIPHLKSLIDTGQTLKMTAATQTVCYCHIDDICAAMLQACDALASNIPGHNMYVVEGDTPMILRDMITLVVEALPGRLKVAFDAVPVDGRKPAVPWVGGPRLPGWSPKITLKQGLVAALTDT